MSTTSSKSTKRPSAAARAEAAAWIARLHGPNRTPEVEAGLRRWMAEEPERAAAFELLTDTWEKSAQLRRSPLERVASWEWPGFRISFSRAALATMAVAIVAIVGTLWSLHSDGFATGIGEQRTVTLKDGSRVFLNTDTRAVVHYDRQARRVELVHGEAMFEVAKRPDWPFIVTAGRQQIRALGTAFLVRRGQDELAVVLVEGKVTVSPIDSAAVREPTAMPGQKLTSSQISARETTAPALTPVSRATGQTRLTGEGVITLAPGDRVTFEGSAVPQLDHPSIEAITAWQRGQIALDNTPLSVAVAEMNRYSTMRIVIENPQAAAIPLSGVFQAGDSEDFAQAVARTYHLDLRIDSRTIVLFGPGAAPDRNANTPN